MKLTPSELVKIPPDQRNKYYQFPYNGPYHGEPELYEILHLKEFREIWGPDHLAIHHVCPACGKDGEWVRNQYAICFNCLIAFDAFEVYIDLTIDDEME